MRARLGIVTENLSPYADDVVSLDAIVIAFYDTLSGAAGERDWDRFRYLFRPEATLSQAGVDGQGRRFIATRALEHFIAGIAPVLQQQSFFEYEISRRVDSFGCLAQVFSTYEARVDPHDLEQVARGISAIQLFHDGERWWILNMAWDDERPGESIPATYLPSYLGVDRPD